MQVKSIAECSKGSILQYFRPALSYHMALRPLFCLFLSGHLRQVSLLHIFLADQIVISEILAWDRNYYLTQAVTCGLFISSIGTHAHGHQVTSLLCQSDNIILCYTSG